MARFPIAAIFFFFLSFPIHFSSNLILGSNLPGVSLGETRKDTASFNNPAARHRPLYGSHLQSIMSPRFYTQYASNFNTLASIFVCSPAHFSPFFFSSSDARSFCFSLQRRNHFLFRFITLSKTRRERISAICISCEEGGSCIASKSVRSSMMYSLNQDIFPIIFHLPDTMAFFKYDFIQNMYRKSFEL